MSRVYFGDEIDDIIDENDLMGYSYEDDYGDEYDDLIMGFDDMDDAELIATLQQYPELMGRGRFKKWLRRRGKRFKKVLKKMPKALKVITGIAMGPAGIAMAVRKRKKKLAAMTPAQRAAYKAKRKKRRRKIGAGIASFLIPGAAAKIGVGALAKRIKKRRRERVSRNRRRVRARAKSSPVHNPVTTTAKSSQPVQSRKIREVAPSSTSPVSTTTQTVATQEKKSGLGSLIPIAAAGALLPFIL